MNKNILDLIICPITKRRLRFLQPHELGKINFLIDAGKIRFLGGSVVKKKLRSGLINANGTYIYPIVGGIFILYKKYAITLKSTSNYKIDSSPQKNMIEEFYNETGWKKVDNRYYMDAYKYEDLRPVSEEYIHKCHMRIKKYIKKRGQYLLDAGSGPIQYREYLSYSKGFDYRVCVDISFLALKMAKKQLKNKGLYILGDLTNLPFKDNSFDAAVSLHVIYHIPKNEQKSALNEIYRTLKSGSTAAVVYSWPGNLSLIGVVGIIARRVGILKRKISKPEFNFQPQNFQFISKGLNFRLILSIWRSVSVDFTRRYIHDWFFGKQILSIIYWLENKFPSTAGRMGRYPLFIIEK